MSYGTMRGYGATPLVTGSPSATTRIVAQQVKFVPSLPDPAVIATLAGLWSTLVTTAKQDKAGLCKGAWLNQMHPYGLEVGCRTTHAITGNSPYRTAQRAMFQSKGAQFSSKLAPLIEKMLVENAGLMPADAHKVVDADYKQVLGQAAPPAPALPHQQPTWGTPPTGGSPTPTPLPQTGKPVLVKGIGGKVYVYVPGAGTIAPPGGLTVPGPTPPGQTTPNGSTIEPVPPGSTATPDGSVVLPDGTIVTPAGEGDSAELPTPQPSGPTSQAGSMLLYLGIGVVVIGGIWYFTKN